MKIDNEIKTKLRLNEDQVSSIEVCESFGQMHHDYFKMLAYIEDEKYLDELNKKRNIELVITNDILKDKIVHKKLIFDNPQMVFWTLFNSYSSSKKHSKKTSVGKNNYFGKNTYVSECGVNIGNNCKFHENVVIKAGVEIGNNVEIGSNSVLGGNGFLVKETVYGLNKIIHDGKVKIGNNVEIGSMCNIDKGFLGKDTLIGEYTKMDGYIHIGHNVKVGKRVLFAAGAIIGGNVEIGDNVFLGLQSVITERVSVFANSFIGASALVSKSCKEPTTYLAQKSKIKDFVL